MVQQQGGSAGQAAAPVLAGSASGCMPAAAPLAHVAGQALQAGAREPAASGASGPVADAAADRALAHLRQRLPEVAALYARLRSQPCKDSGASSGKEPRPRAARRKALAAQQRLPAGALARAADGGEAASTATDGGSSAAAGTRAAAVGDSPGELGAHQNGALNSRLSQQQTAPVAPAELGQPRHAAGPLPQQAAGASVTDGESLPAAAPPEPQAASAQPGSGEGEAAAAQGEQQLPAGAAESGRDTDSGAAAARAEGAPVGKVAERAQRLQRLAVAALRGFAAGLPGAERWPLAGVAGLRPEPGARPPRLLRAACVLVRRAREHAGPGPPPQG